MPRLSITKKILTGLREGGQKALKAVSFLGSQKTILVSVIVLDFLVALLLRVTPVKWGVYLNEFDPFFEYYLATKVAERGNILEGILWWFSWWTDPVKDLDTLFWSPYGRDLRRTSQPGAAIFSAAIYHFLGGLGFEIDLYTIHAFLPAVGASIGVFGIYFLGKEIHDSRVGVFSAFFLSISLSYLYRTNFGAKHEGLAIPFMLFGLYTFLRAYREDSILWSLASGLCLGGVVISWGAYLYPWNLIALSMLLWLFIDPGDTKTSKIFLVVNLICQFFIAVTPRFGPRIAFLSFYSIIPMTTNVLSAVQLMSSRVKAVREGIEYRRIFLAAGVLILLGAIVLIGVDSLLGLRLLQRMAGRIWSVIIPVQRSVIVTTVAEHRVPTWAMFYTEFQSLMIFSLFGAFVLLKRREMKSLLMVLMWITSLYAAASLARLSLILAPALHIAAGVGVSSLIDCLIGLASGEKTLYRGLRKVGRGLSREPLIVAIAIILLMLVPPAVSEDPSTYAHIPPLILSSSLAVGEYDYSFVDWISALEWMKTNLPEATVVASWWDYGYWISVNTGKNSTCDNGTLNTTQIEQVATAFMSNETTALRIFRKLNVSYVVVFEPFQRTSNPYYQSLPYLGQYIYYPGFGGDFGKSYQMVRIAGMDPEKYIGGTSQGIYVPVDTDETRNSTLYHLLFVKTMRRRFFIFEPIQLGYGSPTRIQGYDGPLVVIPQPENFELVFTSEPNEWVLVFKVLYNSTQD